MASWLGGSDRLVPVAVGRRRRPMLAAAGIVVTEISTPIRAPDLAVVSDSMPAVPATKATKNEKKSGLRDEAR